MKKLMMAVVVVAGSASALAMPTKDELTKAQPLVAELMAPAMAKYKAAGYKEKAAAAAKVGDASSEFAKAAETEAAKFLLLKGAVNFYTRGEQYDKAAETVAVLQREVKDVPPAVVAEITGKATGKISESKAPKLYAIYRSAKLQVRAADEAKALAAKLKKAKSDALQRKYAEALAVSGDWKTAYAEFAKVGDAKLKEIAAAESAGNAKNAESGEFWWAYQPAFEDAEDFFKSHAAAYYRKALDAGEITGLKKNIVEQRIAGIAVVSVPIASAPMPKRDGQYCIVDLSGGVNVKEYPVRYVDSATEVDSRESSLVLIKVKAGVDPKGRYSISKDYYIGVYPVTAKQWELVMGNVPDGVGKDRGGMLHSVSWEDFRGMSNKEANGIVMPSSDSFVGRLIAKTGGLGFDLPTEAQWELANRAGIKANNWVSGNGLWERCLDGESRMMGKDPVGAVGKGNCANIKGENDRGECPRAISNKANALGDRGYRLFLSSSTASAATTAVSAAPVSSTGKAWQEKGNTAWLDLGERGKLEFVKCPAGSVNMVTGRSGETARIKITRPFWIMKDPFRWNQMAAAPGIPCGDSKDVAHASWNMDEAASRWMTSEFENDIPKGYVVRLPSLAELEYAFHANTTNRKDPYYDLTKAHPTDDVGKARQKTPNAWGIQDFGWQRCLDTFVPSMLVGYNDCKDPNDVSAIVAKADPVDNLFWAEDADRLNMQRWTNYVIWRMVKKDQRNGDWGPITRLVVGPDLVGEWKAKHGKK